ncbi:MAG: hypothetical protein HY326_04420 [Chloroflexi bacterium]|nr:hypothetical protein [Chloroflexota bacterium]
MMKTLWGIIREGKIELIEDFPLSEGTRVLITILPDTDEQQFWLHVSGRSLAEIWDNPEDDIYAELLQK